MNPAMAFGPPKFRCLFTSDAHAQRHLPIAHCRVVQLPWLSAFFGHLWKNANSSSELRPQLQCFHAPPFAMGLRRNQLFFATPAFRSAPESCYFFCSVFRARPSPHFQVTRTFGLLYGRLLHIAPGSATFLLGLPRGLRSAGNRAEEFRCRLVVFGRLGESRASSPRLAVAEMAAPSFSAMVRIASLLRRASGSAKLRARPSHIYVPGLLLAPFPACCRLCCLVLLRRLVSCCRHAICYLSFLCCHGLLLPHCGLQAAPNFSLAVDFR
ncbi:uncharacterized protein [Dermacentor albipictus]|uniref:uncharacterized protein n=1 Tax=Dermacentor albipictus TaxID=60249 RepID=UPI0031FCFA5A